MRNPREIQEKNQLNDLRQRARPMGSLWTGCHWLAAIIRAISSNWVQKMTRALHRWSHGSANRLIMETKTAMSISFIYLFPFFVSSFSFLRVSIECAHVGSLELIELVNTQSSSADRFWARLQLSQRGRIKRDWSPSSLIRTFIRRND